MFSSICPSQGQTLPDALRRAMAYHSGIGEAQANRTATEAGLDQARTLRQPSVELNAFGGPGAGGGSYLWPGASNNTALTLGGSVGLVGQQLLFDGGAALAQIDRETARVESAALRILSRSESVALSTAQAYLDVLRFIDLGRVAERNVQAHARILGRISAGVSGGRTGEADQRLAEERLAAARATQIEFARRLAEAQASFGRNVGAPPSNLMRPAPPTGKLPQAIDVAVERVRRLYPDVVVAEADVSSAAADLRAAQAARYPTVTLEARVAPQYNVNGISGPQTDYAALVRLRYPLYDSGRIAAREREQAARLSEARFRAERVRQEAELTVRQSWTALEYSRNAVQVQTAQVRAAREVTTSFGQEFEAGRRSLLDLLNAENSRLNAEVGLLASEYGRDAAVFQILALTGELLGSQGVALPQGAIYPPATRSPTAPTNLPPPVGSSLANLR